MRTCDTSRCQAFYDYQIVLRLSPSAYRRVTLFALVALGFIIVTGGAVRLTGSGLGCPDWPNCAGNRVVAPFEYHAVIEFANRIITGLVSIAVILAVLGSLARSPRRRDLTVLSVGLVGGVLGQIALGGVAVLSHLWPPVIMGHFALSMVLVFNAVLLHHRAGIPDDREAISPTAEARKLGNLLLGAAAIVIITGTIVTAAGPHGGDQHVARLGVAVPDVARIHGIAEITFTGLTLFVMNRLRSHGAPANLLYRAEGLLALLIAQGAVGYTQYFTGVPVVLVAIHIAGATSVWAAVVWFRLHLLEQFAPIPSSDTRFSLSSAPLPRS